MFMTVIGGGAPTKFTLTVVKSGSGTVTSSPAGIACGAVCSASYFSGASVSLRAAPIGSTFAGWSNPCSGTGDCTVTLNSAQSITATFVARADDSFPPGGAIPAGWIQPSGSNAAWVVANDDAYAGTVSLKSGMIDDSQKSEISYTANFSAGNVSFARRVSSELDYDFLEFYIDGILKNRWSGEVPWAVVNFPIAAGTHTLRWRYVKDEGVSTGSDAAWIDSVVLPTHTLAAPADCLFNWAERDYPSLFAPAAISNTVAPYYYRYYSQTNAYLGVSAADNHLYYLGPASSYSLVDAGPLSGWLAAAGCQ